MTWAMVIEVVGYAVLQLLPTRAFRANNTFTSLHKFRTMVQLSVSIGEKMMILEAL